MLVDYELEQAIRSGWLGLEPYDPALLQPNSIDVRLDRRFLRPARPRALLNTAAVPRGHMIAVEQESISLRPGEFLLGSTVETVTVPRDLIGQVEGKSSLGRLGLLVHVTAGVIDSGFHGQVTLEIVNLSPWVVQLHAGMTVAQLTFARCSPVRRPYASRYQGQRGPVESRYTGAQHAATSVQAAADDELATADAGSASAALS